MKRSIAPLGDGALAAELGGPMSIARNRQAVALAAAVRGRGLRGVRDVVVTATGVTVHFDPWTADTAAITHALAAAAAPPPDEPSPEIVVPVRYGGADGPDLDEVAELCRCTADEVVRRHSAVTYRAIMMGFVSGFAYLWPLDERLHLPRREQPRTRVPAGSVAIAGAQTAVYPAETPGGWRLIGRTDLRLFDLSRAPASLLTAGARVRFEPRP